MGSTVEKKEDEWLDLGLKGFRWGQGSGVSDLEKMGLGISVLRLDCRFRVCSFFSLLRRLPLWLGFQNRRGI